MFRLISLDYHTEKGITSTEFLNSFPVVRLPPSIFTGEHTMTTAAIDITEQENIQIKFHPGVQNPEMYKEFFMRDLFP